MAKGTPDFSVGEGGFGDPAFDVGVSSTYATDDEVSSSISTHRTRPNDHAASVVSFAPSGLAVITGSGTTVQSAIAQLDAAQAAHAASSTSHPQRAYYAPTSLPGTRFMGAVTGPGAPSNGTYTTGDIVVDLTLLTWWLCSSGGSPGTWVDMSSGRQLDVSKITANPSAQSGTSPTDVGPSVTFTARGRPVRLLGFCIGALNGTATARTENFTITDSSNNLVQNGKMYMAASALSSSCTVNVTIPASDLTVGQSYTYKLRQSGSQAGSSFTIQAGSTFPCFLEAIAA